MSMNRCCRTLPLGRGNWHARIDITIGRNVAGSNAQDYPGVRALAAELGVECTLDPTVTPMMDGDRSGSQKLCRRTRIREAKIERCTIAANTLLNKPILV